MSLLSYTHTILATELKPRSSDSKTDVLCANEDGQIVIFISPFVTERK